MKATVEATDPLHRTIQVEIPWSMISKELDQAYRELSKGAQIKGFRKGRVPRNVLHQRFGKQVADEVLSRLISETYEASLVEHRIRAVARPELDRGRFKEGEPYRYTARVEVRPEINLVNYRFSVERGEPKVTTEMVDGELQQLREEHALLEPIQDREVAGEGDTAIIDYRAKPEGDPQEDDEVKNYQLDVGSGKAVPHFEEQLLGMKVGHTKEFEITFPKDWGSASLAGKRVHFSVRLNALKKRRLPELNDEFVKDLGKPDCHTVADLRRLVEKKVLKQERDRLNLEARGKVTDALIEANPFPVPPALVDREQEVMAQEMESFLSRRGMIPAQLGLSHRSMKKDMRQRAEREVRAALLCAEVARRENIKIDDADLEAHFAHLAEELGRNVANIKAWYQDPAKRDNLRQKLLEEKVLDYLLNTSNMESKGEEKTSSTPGPGVSGADRPAGEGK